MTYSARACRDWTGCFKGLIPGDNLVWQVESLDDFRPSWRPIAEAAVARGRKLIYFRFADHRAAGARGRWRPTVHQLRTADGLRAVHHRDPPGDRASAGRGAATSSTACPTWPWTGTATGCWATSSCSPAPTSTTCESLAYFALLRNCHSLPRHRRPSPRPRRSCSTSTGTRAALRPSAQGPAPLLAHDVHAARLGRRRVPAGDGQLDHRRDPHLRALGRPGLGPPAAGHVEPHLPAGRGDLGRRPARAAARRGRRASASASCCAWPSRATSACCGWSERYLTLADVLDIWKRMIGTGLIGGKSVGMLLARAILKQADPRWDELLEAHDSFFIGSDVFYTFLVENGCWWLRQKQRDPETLPRRRRSRPASASSRAASPTTSSRSSRRCSTTSASRRSSSAPAACWRTTTATPSPASTRASSAPTRARTRSGWRTSCRPCGRSTPAP